MNNPKNASKDIQLYVRVLESIDRGVIAIDQNERISLINPAAQAYTGLSERQGLGRHYEQLFAGQNGLIRLIRTASQEGRSISDHENIQLRRTGTLPLPVSVSCSPIFTSSGEQEGAVLILRDLSRVRELEDAVRQADRLVMLATLAAGLAHEIKNPLGGIKGASQLLAMELPKDSPLQEYAGIMSREAERHFPTDWHNLTSTCRWTTSQCTLLWHRKIQHCCRRRWHGRLHFRHNKHRCSWNSGHCRFPVLGWL